MRIGIIWGQYGPYHVARATAVARAAASSEVFALEISAATRDYSWTRERHDLEITTLYAKSVAEDAPFLSVVWRARAAFRESQLNVCLLPSYSPRQSLAALLAAKSLGIRTVMMNESHAGTSRATGPAKFVKKFLVGLFDAALVGGKPHKRYFASLGLSQEKIFTGYDAVDNDYFGRKAQEIRSHEPEVRKRYGLPEHYFLSLGRFVPKKNLPTLLRAYRLFLDGSVLARTHLVLVGSGEEEGHLRALCLEYKLPIYEKKSAGAGGGFDEVPHKVSDKVSDKVPGEACDSNFQPGVHFYGFRQIEETPVFYALADAFILPSLREEWGLVVNEAMASGLPVVVSETAGCAEDLLEPFPPGLPSAIHLRTSLLKHNLERRIRQNGFVFDPLSSDELSRTLLLLEHGEGLRDTMGRASRRIVGKFSCENFARNALLAAEAAWAADGHGQAGCPSYGTRSQEPPCVPLRAPESVSPMGDRQAACPTFRPRP